MPPKKIPVLKKNLDFFIEYNTKSEHNYMVSDLSHALDIHDPKIIIKHFPTLIEQTTLMLKCFQKKLSNALKFPT